MYEIIGSVNKKAHAQNLNYRILFLNKQHLA